MGPATTKQHPPGTPGHSNNSNSNNNNSNNNNSNNNVSGSSSSIYSRSHPHKPTRSSVDSTSSSLFSASGRPRGQPTHGASRWDSILHAPDASNYANASLNSHNTDSELELDDLVLEMEDRHTSGTSLGNVAPPAAGTSIPTAIVVSDSIDEFKQIFSSDNEFAPEAHHVTAFNPSTVPQSANAENNSPTIDAKLTEHGNGDPGKVKRNSTVSTPAQVISGGFISTPNSARKKHHFIKKQLLFICKLWVRRFRRFVLGKPVEHTGKFCICWCFALDIVHLALLILIPVQLAWTNYFLGLEWIIFYYAVDLLMLIDCWIQARINFMDEYGILVDSSDLILWRYIFRMSGIKEIIFSLPWETLQFALVDGTQFLMLGPVPGTADSLT
ncbi:hypothetical protein HDU82_008723 [Entophlyctis luteolus]|nr:hypothetical protein HDU82_008723 [Entophlyctis luteolus]